MPKPLIKVSMAWRFLPYELYTMMRYLQFDTLQACGLGHFDEWAAAFGEKVTAIELAPEGTGFRSKTRFAKFFNLPELINMWKEAADIQTADMLKLPVPEVEYITVSTEPSEHQQAMVADLADRAKAVRDRKVEPNIDNMLKITSDGRKLALDQRLHNDLLPDDPDSKINTCVGNVFDVWQKTTEIKGTQLVFCDLSTPKWIRPMVPCYHIREYRYAYGAVEPLTGDSFFLVLPYSNTVCMNLYLENLSQKYKTDKIILVCDSAAWHKSNALIIPENILILFLPPATPEMNPIEQVWTWLRRHGFKNEIFPTLHKVVDRLCGTICSLSNSTVKSITARNWILNCF